MALTFQQISARVPYVQSKIGNRADMAAGAPSMIEQWIRDAYIELALNYDFEELLDTTTSVTTISTPTVITDTFNYPDNVRAIKSLTLVDSFGNVQVLEKRSIRFIEAYPNNAPSRPSCFCSYTQGASLTTKTRTVVLRSAPDQIYTLRWRAWMKPTIAGTLSATYIQIPDDWLEILDYAAAMRGFVQLLEPDRAQAIFQLLFGRMDMKSGRKEPGLIAQRLTATEYEYDDTYGARPQIRSLVKGF